MSECFLAPKDLFLGLHLYIIARTSSIGYDGDRFILDKHV